MKKRTITATVFILFLINACQFNQSVNKDLVTSATSRGNGIGCENVDIQVNDKEVNKNTFATNDKVQVFFRNLEGFQKVEDKVYPGLGMWIVKNDKDTIADYPDLLNNLQNGTDLQPLVLNASFHASDVFKPSEKYKLHIKIWDKKGTGKFTYALPFTVQ
ncbi:MAG TPA: hypothetical protein ENK75_06065 [Saprospiraceae bacterium]|nr:hypothetical protein [Saprospiraceae bacterium]